MESSTLGPAEPLEPILPASYSLIIKEFEALHASNQLTDDELTKYTTATTPKIILRGLHWEATDEAAADDHLSEKRDLSIEEEILRRLELFSSAIDTRIRCNPHLSARLWGCVKFLLIIFDIKHKFHHHVQALARSIIVTSLKFSKYLAIFNKTTNLASYIFIFYETILSFTLDAVTQFGVKTRKKTRWTLLNSSKKQSIGKDSFKDLVKQTEEVAEEIEKIVNREHEADHEVIKPDIQKVERILERLEASTETSTFLESNPSLCTIPDILHPDFIGRTAQLEQLKGLFPNRVPEDKQLRVAIHGDSGVGKTQLVLKYLAENRPKYKYVFFVTASSEITILRDLYRIAELVDSSAAKWENRSHRLANVAIKWIDEVSSFGDTRVPSVIIFDNVNTASLATLRSYIPTCLHFHILFTTRDEWVARNLLEKGSSRTFHLKTISNDESVEFLTKRLGKETIAQNSSYDSTTKIAESVGGLPLSLSIVATLSNQYSLPFMKILEHFALQATSLLGYEKLSYKPEVDNTIKLVRIALEEADRKLKGASLFFKTLCFFHQEYVPKSFMTGGGKRLPNLEWLAGSRNRKSAIQSFFRRNIFRTKTAFAIYIARTASMTALDRNRLKSQFTSTRRMDKAIDILQSTALLHRTSEGDIWIHDLISGVILEEIKPSDKPIIHDVAFQVCSRLFTWPRTKDLPKHREYLHLAVRCAEAVHVKVSELSFNLGGFFALEEEHKKSATWYGKALTIDEKNLGKEHRVTLNTAHNMAISLNSQGQYEKALAVFKETLSGREKVSGKNHRRTIELQHSIGSALFNLGKWEESLTYLDEAIAGFEKTMGLNRKKTLRAMLCKGSILFSLARYDEALKIYKRTFEGYEKLLGSDDLNTLCVMCNIGKLYYNQKRYDEAMEWCGKALAAYELKVGKNNPSTQNAFQVMKMIIDGKNNDNQAPWR